MMPSPVQRLLYSPFLVQLVVIRRCNLACGYCNEYDRTSDPVPLSVLIARLDRIRALGTFGICLTGGEPTLHPDLATLVTHCRELGFVRTALISNGFRFTPRLIRALNEAGLQELQISVDGIAANQTTDKVLDSLRTRLTWLRQDAKFNVTVSAVLGACAAAEAFELVEEVKRLGFRPRVLLLHDERGQLQLTPEQLDAYRALMRKIPWSWMDATSYRDALIHQGSAPFRCRAGSRYLYVDEAGLVSWCSQTRGRWSKRLDEYQVQDLREQFHSYKSCQDTCTIGCVRSASQAENWRYQNPPSISKPARRRSLL